MAAYGIRSGFDSRGGAAGLTAARARRNPARRRYWWRRQRCWGRLPPLRLRPSKTLIRTAGVWVARPAGEGVRSSGSGASRRSPSPPSCHESAP